MNGIIKKTSTLLLAFSLLFFAFVAQAATAAELPAGYTEVDAIVAPRGAYIDTGYKPNQNSRTIMDVTVQGKMEYWFSVMEESYTKGAYALCNDNEYYIYYAVNNDGGGFRATAATANDGCVPNGRHTVGITPYSLLIDDEVWATKEPQGDFQLSNNLYLFAANDVAHQNVYTRDGQTSIICHGCTISEGGTLKRNFVPCVRNADAVAGLYDTVEGIFYENAGTGAFSTPESALPFDRTLTSNTYEINQSFAFIAPTIAYAQPTTKSALRIADGATVTLKIAAGATVTLRGGDAFEAWGAGAGIEVPMNAKLYVLGEGTLNAFGGKGASGGNGLNGGNGIADSSTGNFTSGAGGAGGWGGGGAGAGIGGHGANGGGGGNGGKSVSATNWSYTDVKGNSGDNGGAGHNGGNCGAVFVEGTVTVVAHGGAAGDVDGASGDTGQWATLEGSTYWFAANSGAGGGSGAKGGAAQDIGSGGAGGYGGGGGGSGAYYSRYTWNRMYDVDGWGRGGYGAKNGYPPIGYETQTEDTYGGWGGAKGAAGLLGDTRSLSIAESATVIAEDRGNSCIIGWISGNDYYLWEQNRIYHVANGVRSEIAYSTVDANTATLGNGWYVVKGTVERGTITVNGTAHLFLWDGCDLKVTGGEDQPGIAVTPGNALEIFGGPTGSGSLTATGGWLGAGIGGGNYGAGGTVTINGGVVTATGGSGGAGIGGGCFGAGGTTTINGGSVTATGVAGGFAIGHGDGGTGGTTTINGGMVTANGGVAGLLTLGPRVRKIDDQHYREGVTVSFEVPEGLLIVSSRTDGGPLIMTEDGASHTAFFPFGQCLTLGFQSVGFEWRLEGDAEVSFGPFFGDGTIDASRLPKAVRTASPFVDYALPNGETARAEDVFAVYSTGWVLPIGQGNWYVVTGEMTTATIEVNGEANLILADGAKLTVNGGIGVGPEATLNIYGQSAGTGQLIANGAGDCAGIGGRNPNDWAMAGNCGHITINGGTVTATGGLDGAGIGGGRQGAGGLVTINGGSVTATGGWNGAGVGGGWYGAGGTVTINGGTVTAYAGGTTGASVAGMGGGAHGSGCTVTFGENVDVVEGAVGYSSRYVKIAEITDVLKTEVETFDSDWYVSVPRNAYVNTHFKPGSNARVTMDVRVQGASEYWFGCWDGNWDDRAFALGNDGSTVYCGYGSGNTCGGIEGVIPSVRVTVALENGIVYTNGVVWSAAHASDATFSLNRNLYLFAQNRNGTVGVGGSQGSIVCYGCKIWTNGVDGATLVRNFVPARTKDERQIVGLYDTVAGEFYVPHGGTLTLGYDGPTCVGGEIAWSDAANAWIVTPDTGVTEITVAGLPEGDFVAVPPTVAKVGGVADAQIKVRSGAYDITGAFTVAGGAIALNPDGAVNGVPVKPTIGDLDDGESFVVGEAGVAVTVKAIPGLTYTLLRTDALQDASGWEAAGEPVVATGATVTLTDETPPAGAAFYVVKVTRPLRASAAAQAAQAARSRSMAAK